MPQKESQDRDITTTAQLLVEGRTPEMFFREIVEKHLSVKEKLEVREFKNNESLTTFLKVFTRRPEFIEKVQSLGIIRDAEDQPARSAFQSVCSSLKAVGITPPNRIGEIQSCTFQMPEIAGEAQQREIKIGVFILPDCNGKGMIETLCLKSLDEEVSHLATLKCADDYFTCLASNEGIQPRNLDKAKTWTYLSAFGTFEPQVGRAAQKRIWKWDNIAFQPLMKFLKILCGDELL
jgi:hypothetical protein